MTAFGNACSGSLAVLVGGRDTDQERTRSFREFRGYNIYFEETSGRKKGFPTEIQAGLVIYDETVQEEKPRRNDPCPCGSVWLFQGI